MEEDYKTNKNLFDGVNKDITAEQCLEAYKYRIVVDNVKRFK
ncbi:hypothetical protein [Segatella cerevisiae]|jgi:hypothetical protein|nr:hypothetical protein [Segatella cerevisiae]